VGADLRRKRLKTLRKKGQGEREEAKLPREVSPANSRVNPGPQKKKYKRGRAPKKIEEKHGILFLQSLRGSLGQTPKFSGKKEGRPYGVRRGVGKELEPLLPQGRPLESKRHCIATSDAVRGKRFKGSKKKPGMSRGGGDISAGCRGSAPKFAEKKFGKKNL